MNINNPHRYIYEYQAPATLNRAGATVVQDTWYDILPATDNVMIYRVGVGVATTGENLECQFIVDGETIGAMASVGCALNTDYEAVLVPRAINRNDNIQIIARRDFNEPMLLEGKSVQVQVRKTTNNGNGNLCGIVMYGVLKP